MNPYLMQLIQISILALGAYFIYKFTRKNLLKLKIKRNYILIIMIALVFTPMLTRTVFSKYYIIELIFLLIMYYMMFWYIDLSRLARIEKSKPVIGKPKAKPNRMKKDN